MQHNLTAELRNWSDGVLKMLVDEEDCSEAFRQAVVIELASRPDSMVTLTRDMLRDAGTGGCGYTHAQMALLGVSLPPKKGWLSALVGTTVPYWKWKKFCALKKGSQNLLTHQGQSASLPG